MAEPIAIRELRADERAWAAARYREIQFAASPPDAVALVAERAGTPVGLGRLVSFAPGVVELGGIWTDESARGTGVARAMVLALLARPELAGLAARAPDHRLWCIPFVHLVAFYQSFGFTAVAPPWPPAIAAKVGDCIAHAQDVAVLGR
ncbi:MAG TPA: GNAT family N-acetyltransferase [Kofleriaceae bacterium]|nr:GNAT family N-acetyltransferase [Kofleriaceae bacterium]